MPSKSKKQHNLMAAVANNPEFAKKVGIPKSVGEKFMKADKKSKGYQAGGKVAPKSKQPSQSDIDRMMLEGESEYQSTLSSADRKARQDKMAKKKMQEAPAPKKMKAGGSVRGSGKAMKGVRPCRMM